MIIAALLLAAALTGFITRYISGHTIFSWLIGCSVVPIVILFKQLLFAYPGEGALLSLGIAILVGGIYGMIASTAGVLLARYIRGGTNQGAAES